MKEIIKKIVIRLLVVLVIVYPIAYVAASKGFLGEAEIGYYKGLYEAKHTIERSGCVESFETGCVNEDVFLEEFQYIVTTKSGRTVKLAFDASEMDVYQVCDRPKGVAVYIPGANCYQAYEIKFLNGLLKDEDIRVKSLKDVLCNIDQLATLFEANQTNREIPRIASADTWDYLKIEFKDSVRSSPRLAID